MNRHLVRAWSLGIAVFVLCQGVLHLVFAQDDPIAIMLGALTGVGSVLVGSEYYESRRSNR